MTTFTYEVRATDNQGYICSGDVNAPAQPPSGTPASAGNGNAGQQHSSQWQHAAILVERDARKTGRLDAGRQYRAVYRDPSGHDYVHTFDG